MNKAQQIRLALQYFFILPRIACAEYDIHLFDSSFFRWEKNGVTCPNRTLAGRMNKLFKCTFEIWIMYSYKRRFIHKTCLSNAVLQPKLNNLMWPMAVKSVVLLYRVTSETKQRLKEIILRMLLCTDISYSTCHFDIWTANAPALWLHIAACNRCKDFTFAKFLSTFSEGLIKILKQSIKAHQHPLIKVSFNNAWLSTSMGNQGTAVTTDRRVAQCAVACNWQQK